MLTTPVQRQKWHILGNIVTSSAHDNRRALTAFDEERITKAQADRILFTFIARV